MVCTSLGSLLRPLFYFLCSNLKANPVVTFVVMHAVPILEIFTFIVCMITLDRFPFVFSCSQGIAAPNLQIVSKHQWHDGSAPSTRQSSSGGGGLISRSPTYYYRVFHSWCPNFDCSYLFNAWTNHKTILSHES